MRVGDFALTASCVIMTSSSYSFCRYFIFLFAVVTASDCVSSNIDDKKFCYVIYSAEVLLYYFRLSNTKAPLIYLQLVN